VALWGHPDGSEILLTSRCGKYNIIYVRWLAGFLNRQQYTPKKLTWNLKITKLKKENHLPNLRDFGFHVHFQGFFLALQWRHRCLGEIFVKGYQLGIHLQEPGASRPCGRCVPSVACCHCGLGNPGIWKVVTTQTCNNIIIIVAHTAHMIFFHLGKLR